MYMEEACNVIHNQEHIWLGKFQVLRSVLNTSMAFGIRWIGFHDAEIEEMCETISATSNNPAINQR